MNKIYLSQAEYDALDDAMRASLAKDGVDVAVATGPDGDEAPTADAPPDRGELAEIRDLLKLSLRQQKDLVDAVRRLEAGLPMLFASLGAQMTAARTGQAMTFGRDPLPDPVFDPFAEPGGGAPWQRRVTNPFIDPGARWTSEPGFGPEFPAEPPFAPPNEPKK